MAIRWGITNMKHVTADGFVIAADWKCTADGGGLSAYVYGQQSFPYDPDQPDFIPYGELTEPVVVGWVQAAMGEGQVENYEGLAQRSLDALLNPTTANGLPWSNS